ncbi:hypothetical protein EXIGLDRAFT_61326 [Exidia glandulosa HHB12029]|uniref:Uncharacterized protein n=1 Tax=Exidia glandulosa HHB12029 TaxID=1314781 RepID=A0A166AKM6_EXIGL|nr:hypothetical protein EXIGLDRAFT_61326 [Exidia glandulosa HHB12029]
MRAEVSYPAQNIQGLLQPEVLQRVTCRYFFRCHLPDRDSSEEYRWAEVRHYTCPVVVLLLGVGERSPTFNLHVKLVSR